MLELKDTALEVVSGGTFGFTTNFIKVKNSNYANVQLSRVEVEKGSTMLIGISQYIVS